jgi:hypothetical protein
VNLDPTSHLALKYNQLTSQHGILSLESVGREENFAAPGSVKRDGQEGVR